MLKANWGLHSWSILPLVRFCVHKNIFIISSASSYSSEMWECKAKHDGGKVNEVPVKDMTGSVVIPASGYCHNISTQVKKNYYIKYLKIFELFWGQIIIF